MNVADLRVIKRMKRISPPKPLTGYHIRRARGPDKSDIVWHGQALSYFQISVRFVRLPVLANRYQNSPCQKVRFERNLVQGRVSLRSAVLVVQQFPYWLNQFREIIFASFPKNMWIDVEISVHKAVADCAHYLPGNLRMASANLFWDVVRGLSDYQ